jgi:heme-degrading monooxygenase HmoA
MFVLHVKIKMKPDAAMSAEQVFVRPFKEAITMQPGFRDVKLLRPTGAGEYVLSIAFENQTLQQQWVATDLHDQVWGEMEKHFDSYTLATFSAV